MGYVYILPSYFIWHYTEAFRDIGRVWTNFLWFLYNFFSISLLTKTLFSPWRRIKEERRREGFHLEDIAEAVFVTTVMRLVGAMLRLVLIVIGIVSIIVVFWVGLVFYIVWALLPFLAVWSFLYGLSILVM